MRTRQPSSLTFRLIVTLTLGAGLLWIIASAISVTRLQHELDEAFDAGLRETAQRLLPLALHGLREPGESDGDEIPLLHDGSNAFIVYQLRAGDGQVILRSRDAPVAGFAAPLQSGFLTLDDNRIFTMGLDGGDYFIQVAEPLAHRRMSLLESAVAVLLPLLVLIPLSAAGIWLAVRRGLRPLHQLGREVENRGAANLAPLPTDDLPPELRPIGIAVDDLLSRLRQALDTERAFAANSAHELRTPIAGSLAQTQRLLAELDGHPASQRARHIEAALKRVGELAEKLLQLARADAGMATVAETVDLMPAMRAVFDDCRARMTNPARLVWNVPAGAQLSAHIDVDAFGIALRNLLDNAIAHGGSAARIALSVPLASVVSVVNDGPVVDTQRLADRFVRGPTEAHGAGLGLAIVATIMQQTGGRLELASPAPGRTDGFEARLVLA